jgi:NADPH-dependent 2,4-dienoyl-CoA reductase/sulfur reductase-like enzyme
VGWRDRQAITFQIKPYLEKKDIAFVGQPVTRIDAEGNALELADGGRLAYDHLVITTGPKLSFDEVPGAGPQGQVGAPRQGGLREVLSLQDEERHLRAGLRKVHLQDARPGTA